LAGVTGEIKFYNDARTAAISPFCKTRSRRTVTLSCTGSGRFGTPVRRGTLIFGAVSHSKPPAMFCRLQEMRDDAVWNPRRRRTDGAKRKQM
jgi:hypothetical protein